MGSVFDQMVKEQRDKDKIFDIVRDMQLMNTSKQLDVKDAIEKLMPVLKENSIQPNSPLLQERLEFVRANIEKVDSEKAKKVAELQQELQKRKLE